MSGSKIKLVIFDLDGVLVDACEWHCLSFTRVAQWCFDDPMQATETEAVPRHASCRHPLDLSGESPRQRVEWTPHPAQQAALHLTLQLGGQSVGLPADT
jgi:phosphoglycolate phosphatase-like HAD superfamily hydrolase